MNENPYDHWSERTLSDLWNLGHQHAERGIHNPPKFSGVNERAIIAYQRGHACGSSTGQELTT